MLTSVFCFLSLTLLSQILIYLTNRVIFYVILTLSALVVLIFLIRHLIFPMQAQILLNQTILCLDLFFSFFLFPTRHLIIKGVPAKISNTIQAFLISIISYISFTFFRCRRLNLLFLSSSLP